MAARGEELSRALDALGVAPDVRSSLEKWLRLLEEWNQRIDLTAARTEGELCDLMLADAAQLAAHVPHGARVVDVGAGAGAPGLALALMRPDLAMTLVEPLAKRAAFLRTVLGNVGRVDVAILRERGEAVAGRSPRGFDVAVSRATLAPPAWIPLGLALAPAAWALLAKEPPPEIPGARIDVEICYTWPATGAERRAVRYV
ncbi:MAG: class I SAM-dependent methyltransferase [Labilithrix sp.]|nr:class I SAM-dependent methyltransferase [Labilithrix sp.]